MLARVNQYYFLTKYIISSLAYFLVNSVLKSLLLAPSLFNPRASNYYIAQWIHMFTRPMQIT